MMKTIGKFLAVISAFIFVISGVVAIVFFNIEQKAFSPETYKVTFKEQGLYDAAPAIFTDLIISSMEDSGGASILITVLNRDDMALVIASLLPPEEFEFVINEAFDSFFDYLNGDTESISISLLSLKRHLVSEGGMQAFTQLLLAQPECTPAQALQITLGFLSSGEGLIFCRPPQEAIGFVIPIIETQLQVMTSNLPDRLILADSSQTGLVEFRARLDRIRAIMRLTPAFPMMMLLSIVIFTVRSINDWLNWWGIPILITGIMSALLALIGTPLIRLFVDDVILQGNADMPTIFLDIMRNVTGSLVSQILGPIAIAGIILALIGVGMVVGASFMKRQATL
ncbi:MAG TPA: hypothetical protein VLA72_08955 [Anaerolineales bacterium]|jgi:hypothetical protein|nr:hypothetical protein [Anaerolineales bacterium]